MFTNTIFFVLLLTVFSNAIPTDPSSTESTLASRGIIVDRGEALINPRKSVTLGKEKYDLVDLPAPYQGSMSEIYNATRPGGDPNKPDIMKIVKKPAPGPGSEARMRQEIRNTKWASLLLGAWEKEEGFYYLLLRNVRNGFPKAGDPPLRTFPEWYLIDKDMNAEEGLKKHKEATKTFLRTFTKKGLQYHNIHLRSVFINEPLELAHGVDYTPEYKDSEGKVYKGTVEEYRDEKHEEFLVEAAKTIDEQYTIEKLEAALSEIGGALRDKDKKDL